MKIVINKQVYEESELKIGHGIAIVDSIPFEAPWLNAFGACLIKITDLRRNEKGEVEFQLGDENNKPYKNGNIWRKADAFFEEWPQ